MCKSHSFMKALQFVLTIIVFSMVVTGMHAPAAYPV